MCKFNLYKIVNIVLRFFFLYIGAVLLSDCFFCIGGYYCVGNGLIFFIGFCVVGYYCSDNEIIFFVTFLSFLCFFNYKCFEGFVKLEFCLFGEFQVNMGMLVCSKCFVGFYCNIIGNVLIKYDCLLFYYCLEGEFQLYGYYSCKVVFKFFLFY